MVGACSLGATEQARVARGELKCGNERNIGCCEVSVLVCVLWRDAVCWCLFTHGGCRVISLMTVRSWAGSNQQLLRMRPSLGSPAYTSGVMMAGQGL